MNRRTRRTVTIAAIIVLLLAGVLGELTFGDRNGFGVAEAQTSVGAAGGAFVDADSRNTNAADSASASVAVISSSTTAFPSDSLSADPGSRADVSTPVADGPESDDVTLVTSFDDSATGVEAGPGVGETAPTPTSETGSDANEHGNGRSHGVDDHAVAHSERHEESEAVSHGRDEEAHRDHR